MNEWAIRVSYLKGLKQKLAKKMLKNQRITKKQYTDIRKGLKFSAFMASPYINLSDSKKFNARKYLKIRKLLLAYKKEEKMLNYITICLNNKAVLANELAREKREKNPYQNATEITKAQDAQQKINADASRHNIKSEETDPLTDTDAITFTNHPTHKAATAKEIEIAKLRQQQGFSR